MERLLCLLLCLHLSTRGMETVKIIGGFALFNAMMAYGSVTAHELGHAVVAKELWGDPIQVTIGSGKYRGPGVNFEAILANVLVGGMMGSIRGAALVDRNKVGKSKWKGTLYLAAGPLLGSATVLTMYYMLKKVLFSTNNEQMNGVLKASAVLVGYNHLSQFIPYSGTSNEFSDGAQIFNVWRGSNKRSPLLIFGSWLKMATSIATGLCMCPGVAESLAISKTTKMYAQ
jgi:Zn-dependent protease